MAPPLKLRTVADAVLFKLFESTNEGIEALKSTSIAHRFANQVRPPVISLAVSDLSERKLVRYNPMDENIRITKSGFLHVEKEIERANSFMFAYSQYGNDWLFETGGQLEIPPITSEPVFEASPNINWEPLPIDRSNPSVTTAIEKIEELVTAVEQDNGYASNEPDERNYIVAALKAGANALRIQGAIYHMQFNGWIWDPIERIATKFKDHAIGILAEGAKAAIKIAFVEYFKRWMSGH